MTPEEVRLDLAGPMSSRWFVGLHEVLDDD
jgi:hypothetical protein